MRRTTILGWLSWLFRRPRRALFEPDSRRPHPPGDEFYAQFNDAKALEELAAVQA
jgi:hypothetical protein